jgi:hypothetical protein
LDNDIIFAAAIYMLNTRPNGRDIAGKFAVKICGEAYTEGDYDTNGGKNLCLKSIPTNHVHSTNE